MTVTIATLGFPRIGPRREPWKRVRIEFEYRSSNFRSAGHDPRGGDLIVCWLHNWTDCPLEVVELRSVVAQLMGKG